MLSRLLSVVRRLFLLYYFHDKCILALMNLL